METSDETHEDQPTTGTCLWCGADRPVDVDVCPMCEHAWIDATIDEARQGKLETVAAPTPAVKEKRPWWRRKWMPLAVAAVVALVYGVVFWVMWDDTQPDKVAATTTLATTAATTAPPEDNTTSTSLATTTTTTTSTTTTTTTTTTLPPIPEVGPALDVDSLTLGAFALGPLRLGSETNEATGRLVATFGQPDEQFPVGENWGLCPTDTGRALRWGHLNVILTEGPDTETMVGYRLEAREDDSPTAGLRSLSGLALGDPLTRVQALYANAVTDSLDDDTPIFIVLRSSDRRTLLWGTLSDDDDPVVASINSPRPCDGGPFES